MVRIPSKHEPIKAGKIEDGKTKKVVKKRQGKWNDVIGKDLAEIMFSWKGEQIWQRIEKCGNENAIEKNLQNFDTSWTSRRGQD